MWWQRNNWKNRCCRLEKTNEKLRQELALCYQKMNAQTERLKNADHNRTWCDSASNFLGPAAAAWLSKLDDITAQIEDLKSDFVPIQDAYYQVDHHYPWDDRYDPEDS